MNHQNDSAAEHQLSPQERLEPAQVSSPPSPAASPGSPTTASGSVSPAGQEITVGKRLVNVAGKDIEVFTMKLGPETIDLLPLRTWAQLDLYKWRVRGKLPGTPAGIEIGFDHAKLMGQTVSPADPAACAKLEELFSQWLAMERETRELARRKAELKAATPAAQTLAPSPQESAMHFRVDLDNEGQVHIQCVKGKETLARIGLNIPGFQSLINQGWMRKPHSLKTGALHDWVELDGVLYSFEKGHDCSAELAKALNESYLPLATAAKDKEVVVYSNAASSTGFDIQFPAKVGGTVENRRRPLGDESLALLQDRDHCGLLQPGLVIKLSRPCFIFKQKTPDGGERYLEQTPENVVKVRDDDGAEKLIDLSQPVNYLRLSAVELTAVLNHPAINRHTKAGPPEPAQVQPPSPAPAPNHAPPPAPVSRPAQTASTPAPPKVEPGTSPPQTSPVASPATASAPPPAPPKVGSMPPPQPRPSAAAAAAPPKVNRPAEEHPVPREAPAPAVAAPAPTAQPIPPAAPPPPSEPLPNLWINPILQQQPIRFDWFTCLIYAKIATWAGNSNQGQVLGNECWFIRLSEAADMADPAFRGIFDSQNGSFGYISDGYVVRFENGAAALGTAESALQAPGVRLLAVGMEATGSVVFIVGDDYRSKFGVPGPELAAKLAELNARGGKLMSVSEVLASHAPLEVVWTVPAQQPDANNPQALEQLRPDSA